MLSLSGTIDAMAEYCHALLKQKEKDPRNEKKMRSVWWKLSEPLPPKLLQNSQNSQILPKIFIL